MPRRRRRGRRPRSPASTTPRPAREVEIERAFLAELGSGCSLPVGAYVDALKLHTFLAGEDSGIIVSETIELTGETGTDIEIARRAARDAHEVVSDA